MEKLFHDPVSIVFAFFSGIQIFVSQASVFQVAALRHRENPRLETYGFGTFFGTLIYSSTPLPSGGLILITLVVRVFRKTLNLIKLERKKQFRSVLAQIAGAVKAPQSLTRIEQVKSEERVCKIGISEFVLRDLKHHHLV